MDIFEQLKRDEGVRIKPYTDSVGKLTIGVGRNLTDVGLFEKEIQTLLENDVAFARAGVNVHFPWSGQLDEARRGVLVNMAFNMGIWTLSGFTKFLAAVQGAHWEIAAGEMLDSTWARQVGVRAVRLAQQMRTGEWQ